MRNARRQSYKNEHEDKFDGFPPEAFDYDDDVTAEGVETMRKRAQGAIGAEEWVVVDGFGPNHPSA